MTNPIKSRLQAGETIAACWINTGSPEACDIVVNAGWDVVVIDCEHGAAPLEEGLSLIRAVEAAGGQAILRVPDGHPTTLKRALDRGARSIIVPMVNSAEEARAIAFASLYPPHGGRGYAAPIVRGSYYGRWSDYAQTAHEELLLIVQCEHVDAVEELREIGKIPGIDMVFVGPNDLAGSMNLLERLEHPDLVAKKAEIEQIASEEGIALGTITGGGRGWSALKAAGYSLIIGPNDISLLFNAARSAHNDMLGELQAEAAPLKAARGY